MEFRLRLYLPVGSLTSNGVVSSRLFLILKYTRLAPYSATDCRFVISTDNCGEPLSKVGMLWAHGVMCVSRGLVRWGKYFSRTNRCLGQLCQGSIKRVQ